MKVIILAGGKTDLPGKLKNIPKSLIKIKGKPLLEYQLDLLKKYKFDDICLSLHYKAEEILKYLKIKDPKANISKKIGKVAGIEYVVETKPLGTGGAIMSASKDLKKDFLIMNGDTLSNFDLNNFIKFYKTNVSEPKFFSSSSFVRSITSGISPLRKRVSYEEILGAMAVYYDQNVKGMGLVKTKNNRVVEFQEDPEYQYSGYVNAGFYVLSPQLLQTKCIRAKKEGEAFAIEECIFPLLAEKKQLLAFVHRGLWTDIGSEEGLAKAENIVEKLNEKE
ncbi:nucleotidyltransferase family protein [Patescibacteria group bacterium]|nr:nucleotidyltransferase family protein [Patescibacteria group bacterium]MBU4458427.1 nucleotidyltransferase family protein [Patescibacteria group bacterium]MCG2696125.1 nucleotidyltransferase family protein [Candidatus Portnoybacteria bacterium]